MHMAKIRRFLSIHKGLLAVLAVCYVPWLFLMYQVYAAKPFFWLCLDLVFSLTFVRGEALRKIFFRVGLALAAAYALCAVCWYAGVPAVRFIYPVIRLAEAALLFLIPGVLIGAGLEKAEFKH